MHPREGIRHVLDLRRIFSLGVQAVVRRHHADPVGNKPRSNPGDLRLVPTMQSAAMNPEKHRETCFVPWQINVQLVLGLAIFAPLLIANILNHPHLPDLRHNWLGRLSRGCLFFLNQFIEQSLQFPTFEKAIFISIC